MTPTIASQQLGSSTEAKLKGRDLLAVCCVLLSSVALKALYFEWRAGGSFASLVYPDETNYYLSGAQLILEQGPDFFLTSRSLWTGPLNPLWIAVFDANVMAVKTANLALWAGAGLLVFDMARRMFGRRAGLLAVVFYSLSFPFFNFTPTLLTEPLFVPLFLLSLWLAVRGAERDRSHVWWLGSGLVLGLATLVRPTTQFLPFFLLMVVALGALLNRAQPGLRPEMMKIGRQALLFLVGALLVAGPYVVKNAVFLDKVGVANGSGAVLYLGNDLRKAGDEPLYSQMHFDTFEITAPHTHLDTQGDALLMDAALEEIRQHPIDVALLQIPKGLRLLFGSADHYFWPYGDALSHIESRGAESLFSIWDMVFTASLVVFGTLGMIVRLSLPSHRLFLIGSVVYFALVHTLLFPIPRMFMPSLPVLAIFAAGYVGQNARRLLSTGVAVTLAIVLVISLSGRVLPPSGVSDRYIGYFDSVAVSGVGGPVEYNDLIADADGFEATGGAPYVVYDVDGFEALTNQLIFIELEAIGPDGGPREAIGRVYWAADGAEFSEERNESFTFRFGADQTYAVSPSFGRVWEGEISRLRISFPAEVPGARYQIGDIQVRK